MSIDSLFNEEQIAALKSGEVLGGSLKEGFAQATTFTPTSTVSISGHDKNLKPRIRDGAGNTVEQKVVAPNTSKYNKLNAERKLAELDAEEAKAKELEALDPQKILASINALDRTVRRLSKQVKALEAKS